MTLTPEAFPWIVAPALRKLTPNRYDPGVAPAGYVRELELVVVHYTAAGPASGSVAWLCNPEAKASAHLVIDRDGTAYQLAPLTSRTWHAGGKSSSWRGGSVNSRSIGIELANYGPLNRTPDGLATSTGRIFRGPTVTDGAGKAWEAYTVPQVDTLAMVLELLACKWPILRTADERPGQASRICGHQDVDPTRKRDPGPALDLALLRSTVQRGSAP